MNDVPSKVKPSDDIDIGLLTTDDWCELTAFFDTAVFDNPSTENKMRIRLGMKKDDTFEPEFQKTVDLYEALAGIGQDFKHGVQEEAVSLADDIVHYNTTVQSIFPRVTKLIDYFDLGMDEEATTQEKLNELVELWRNGQTEGLSGQIKTRFSTMLSNLVEEAEKRAVRAEALTVAILGDGKGPTDEDGMLNRLKAVKSGFDAQKVVFHDKFGETSKDVVDLEKRKARIEEDLAKYRKKDDDETIVLSTAPAYLVIPVLGPFVMAGVLIGVGVDMAHVRAEIDKLVEESRVVEAKLERDQRFVNYFDLGHGMVEKMAAKCEAIAPRLKRLGNGWRAISRDLQFVVNLLSDDASKNLKKEDFSSFAGSLGTAQMSWAEIGAKADHFRLVAVSKKCDTVDDLMQGAEEDKKTGTG